MTKHPATFCWICGAPCPGEDPDGEECLQCITGETGPWYFVHHESDSLVVTDNPFEAFLCMCEPLVENIDKETFLKLQQQGYT